MLRPERWMWVVMVAVLCANVAQGQTRCKNGRCYYVPRVTTPTTTKTKTKTVQHSDRAAADMAAEANKLRQQWGRQPHTQDPQLQAQAQRWADHLAATGGFYHGGGEQVIARGYATPQDAVRGWYRSCGHRAWLMSNTTRCGYAAARGPWGWRYVGVYR